MNNSTITNVAIRTIGIISFASALIFAVPASAESVRGQAEMTEASTHRVELNSASLEELMSLPGIGPALAQRIVEARASRPFRNTQDLMRVKGIGRSTLQRLLPYVRVAAPPAAGQPRARGA